MSVVNAGGIRYAWTVPSGWTITAGQNSHCIKVNAGTASGTVSVTPDNSCGVGAAKSLAVTANQAPTLTRSNSYGAASQTVCSNTAISTILYNRGGGSTGFAAISWSPSAPAGIGVSGGGSGGNYTISGMPTAIGAYTYTISTTGQSASCPAAAATGTITRGGVGTTSTISIAAYTCSGGVSGSANTISVSAYTSSACSSGGVVGSINTISVSDFSHCEISDNGIGSVNTISVSPAN